MSPFPARGRARALHLGPLERDVLDALWQGGRLDVAAVHAQVGATRRLARSTVHSTLERLVRKRLATRQRCGRAYAYEASVSRGEWVGLVLEEIVGSMPGVGASALVAGFIDLAERTDEDMLDRLDALVRERRARRGEPR